MASCISLVPDSQEWKQAYMAAILEKDRTLVADLIAEAKEKLASRQDALKTEGRFPCDEAEAIDDAYVASPPEQLAVPQRFSKLVHAFSNRQTNQGRG